MLVAMAMVVVMVVVVVMLMMAVTMAITSTCNNDDERPPPAPPSFIWQVLFLTIVDAFFVFMTIFVFRSQYFYLVGPRLP